MSDDAKRIGGQVARGFGLFGEWLVTDDEDFLRRHATDAEPPRVERKAPPGVACKLCAGNPVIQIDAAGRAVRVPCPECSAVPKNEAKGQGDR